MGDQPSFRRTCVFVRMRRTGVSLNLLVSGGLRIVESIRVPERPTLGSKVDDQEVLIGANGALGVGAKVGAS